MSVILCIYYMIYNNKEITKRHSGFGFYIVTGHIPTKFVNNQYRY